MFLCEIMTPAGVRVDPEVYCKYAVSGELSTRAAGAFVESRSSRSTSMTDGADSPDFDSTYSATSPATEDVVRTAEGDASRSTELTRSSLTPPAEPKRNRDEVRPAVRRETRRRSRVPAAPVSRRGHRLTRAA